MATYTFSVDNYEIKETRSRHEDTNYVTVVLSVNGQPIGSPQQKFMGNQNNGTYSVGLSFPNVEVPEGATVRMLYSIINRGHGDQAAIEKALGDLAQQQMKKADDFDSGGSGDPPPDKIDWGPIAWGLFKKYGLPLLFADCDGPITPFAGRQIKWNSSELKALPSGTKYEEAQDEPGSDSATGCGSNSHYIVHYTVTPAAATVNVAHSTGGQIRDHRTR